MRKITSFKICQLGMVHTTIINYYMVCVNYVISQFRIQTFEQVDISTDPRIRRSKVTHTSSETYRFVYESSHEKITLWTLRKVSTRSSISMLRRLTRTDMFRLLWIFCFNNHYSIPLRRNVSVRISLRSPRRLIWIESIMLVLSCYVSYHW